MIEVLLFILGGLGCLLMMGAMMWLMGRFMGGRHMSPKALVRLAGRVRREGLRATLQSSVQAIAAWAQAEQPDLGEATAPDGTVTMLFTDIEGSTVANERLGDERWMEVLRGHNSLVRDAVEANGGYEVKSQGDGFMVAFPSARAAVRCAIAIQRAVAGHADGRLPEPVRVRIGLHTGEAMREEGDFYGRSVTVAARIADRADGGEILASSLVRELATGATEVDFEDTGEVQLRGIRDRQRIYRIEWEDTRARPGAPEPDVVDISARRR